MRGGGTFGAGTGGGGIDTGILGTSLVPNGPMAGGRTPPGGGCIQLPNDGGQSLPGNGALIRDVSAAAAAVAALIIEGRSDVTGWPVAEAGSGTGSLGTKAGLLLELGSEGGGVLRFTATTVVSFEDFFPRFLRFLV